MPWTHLKKMKKDSILKRLVKFIQRIVITDYKIILLITQKREALLNSSSVNTQDIVQYVKQSNFLPLDISYIEKSEDYVPVKTNIIQNYRHSLIDHLDFEKVEKGQECYLWSLVLFWNQPSNRSI